MNRLDELTLKLLDDTIDADELKELAGLAKEPEGQQSLRRLMELESYLQSACRSSIADRVIDEIRQERRDRIEEGVMRAVSQSRSPVDTHAHGSGSDYPTRLTFLVCGVAAIAAFLLLVFFSGGPSDNKENAIARLNLHGSIASISDADGQTRLAKAKQEPFAIRPGEAIATQRDIDTAEILYADGTKIELLGEARIRLGKASNGSKEIVVLSGLIQADVKPQPAGRPLRIITEAATLEVLGTSLGVEVREASTRLGVATGRVAMTRKADGQRVEVEAGRYATATESTSEPLQSHPFPKLPREWSEDFQNGLPVGWRTGELVEVADGTATRAVRSRRTGDKRFVITSHNAWQEGDHALCRIDRNSVLHLQIRQSAFARITIMIGTRSYPPAKGRVGGNLFYTKKAWNEELLSDTWKTISVPLRDVDWQMKRGRKVRGASDLEGLAAYLVHVSTMEHDAGLIIGRMWITNSEEGGQL